MTAELFSEPGPLRRSGLEHGRCEQCGAHALVDAAWRGSILCGGCLRVAHDVPAIGWTPGAIGPVVRVAAPGPARQPVATPPYVAPAPTVRVLTPADRHSDAAPAAQVPARARALAEAAQEEGHAVRVTYALAEDVARGELMHSVAVRVAGLGYALYINGHFVRAGQVRPHVRAVSTAGEFEALVAGRPWCPPPPAPVGPCPRCARPVRWTAAMTPYKHKHPTSKESCDGS